MGQYKKSKLQALYCHQKHATRITNFKGKFTCAKLLLEQIKAMTVYEMNILHTYTLKPINKYTVRSKNVLFKPLCKKNFAKFKLSYRGPYLWNKFIAPSNDLLEVITIMIFKIRLKNIVFASTNILEDF